MRLLLFAALMLIAVGAFAREPEVISPRGGIEPRHRHHRTADEKRSSVLRWWENAAIQKSAQEKAADAKARK